jgi:hypothetical protein
MTAKKIARKAAKKTGKPAGSDASAHATSDVLAGSPNAYPPGFSNPATRALQNIGITRLSQLTTMRENDIAALHGMGPKGVKVLNAALQAQGKSFRA